MKKTKLILTGLIIISAFATGCSNKTNDTSASVMQSQIDQLKKENESLKADQSKSQSTGINSTMSVTKDSAQDSQKEKVGNTLKLGDTMTVDNIMTLTLNSCEWGQDVRASSVQASNYIQGQDGETYLILRGTLTNLSTESIRSYNAYNQEIKLLINDKYKFEAYVVCESADNESISDIDVKPVQTLNVIIYTAIPNNLKDQFENATYTINIVSNPEDLEDLLDLSKPHKTFKLKISASDFKAQ